MNFTTHYCTSTTALSNANADIAYLNARSEKAQPMEIVGVLADDDKRLKHINIMVRKSGRAYRTKSDKQGWFRLIVPKPGTYRVTMFLPLYADVGGTSRELEQIKNRVRFKRSIVLEYEVLLNPGKCAFVNPPLFINSLEYKSIVAPILEPDGLKNRMARNLFAAGHVCVRE